MVEIGVYTRKRDECDIPGIHRTFQVGENADTDFRQNCTEFFYLPNHMLKSPDIQKSKLTISYSVEQFMIQWILGSELQWHCQIIDVWDVLG